MKFKSGYLGICIVIVALLLGTAGSLLLNVDKTAEASTKYDYKTDITGLFNTSQEPQYIDFNPATNITGYTPQFPADSPNPTGLDYVQSSISNNYRVPSVVGTTGAGSSGTLNNSSSYAQAVLSGGSYALYNAVPDADWLRGYKITYLSTFLSDVFGPLDQYEQIVLTFTYPDNAMPGRIMSYNNAFVAYSSSTGIPQYGGGYSLKRAMPDTMTIDTANATYTMTYTGYPGEVPDVYSIYTSYLCYGDATHYHKPSGGSTSTSSTSLSLSYSSTLTTISQYEYVDPSQGVSIVTGYSSPVIWDNDTITTDYDNYVVSFVLGPSMTDGTPDASNYWLSEFRYYDNNSNETQIDIKHDVSGGVGKIYATCTVWQSPDTYNPIPSNTFLGNYDYVLLTLDIRGTPTLTIYPIVDFINYTNFTALDAPIASVSVTSNGTPDLDKIYIYSSGSPRGRWLVSDTTLFLNTYNSVLIDPSIDLDDYWPDMDSYRFAFQSFAIYGDSITINGVNYTLFDSNKIEIDGKTYTLDNFYISFSEQGKASITFKNVNRTVELGDTVDKTVSFDGVWYFSTALYEGSITTEEVYEWDDNLIANIDMQLVLLLTLGLLLGLSLLFVALLHVNLSLMDKVVLVFAGAVILCIIGGL